MTDAAKTREIIRHIHRVEDNCNEMAIRMLESGLYDAEFSRQLIIRGRLHDASKFEEFEFNHLWKGDPNFEEALKIHHSKNRHHPEFHTNGIKDMTDLDLAEMVCDCCGRSQQFIEAIKDFLFKVAPIKYGYTENDEVWKKLELFLNLIKTPAFINEKI